MSTNVKTCLICGRETVALGHHLQAHNISLEDYYNKYIGSPKYCSVCGKKTKFADADTGYKEYCSFRCEQIAKGVDVNGEPYKRKHCCLICGAEARHLGHHLRAEHCLGRQEYYDKYYKTEDEGICPVCGKPTTFDRFSYNKFCSIACLNKSEYHKEQIKQSNLNKYGVEYCFQAEEVKEKIRATNLERYGDECYSRTDDCRAKIVKTSLERYGVLSPLQSSEVKEKIRQTSLRTYGTNWPTQAEATKEKIKQTNIERYGCGSVLSNEHIKQKIRNTNLEKYGYEVAASSPRIQEKIKQTCLEKYGGNPLTKPEAKEKAHQACLKKYGTDFPVQAPEIKEKIKKTYSEKYGGHPMYDAEISGKVKRTRTENGTWNTSAVENEVYSSLAELFGEDDITRSYKEARYNYKCDFYIKSRDLFIELNAYKTHMGHWFDENNPEDVSELKRLENSDKGYDNHVAKSWLGDTKKREAARQNNLNYVVFWRKEDADLWTSLGYPDGKDYIKEYSWLPDRPTLDPFCEFPKKLSPGTSICRAVAKAANGDSLFHRECKMWRENPPHKGTFLQPWLYANRLKYMDNHKNPEEITDAELIRGFTISGLIRGYSRYDVKPMKEIIEEYNIKSIYDPCAGWGERLALCGALGVSYESVDINEKVVEGHNKIITHYKLDENCSSTCEDSAKYTPKGSHDAVFTCPPYLDKEHYTDKGAENLAPDEFEKWWKKVCNNFPDNAQHVFIHIDEATKPYIISGLENNGWALKEDRYVGKEAVSHFNRGKNGVINKKNYESVLIFDRNSKDD